jgi:hypothetical protein
MIVLRETAEKFECERCIIPCRGKRAWTSDEQGGRFACIACNAEIHEWHGYHDYTEWRALNWSGWLPLGLLAAVQRLAEQGPGQARWAHRPAQPAVSPEQTVERQPELPV